MTTLLIAFLASLNLASAQTSPASDGGGDQVDLQKLDDKYWAAKDSDLSVVQNRTFSKNKRFYLSASYGPLVNDEWNIGRMTNLATGYYFSERLGVEFAYEAGSLTKNDGVVQIEKSNGLRPNYNKFVSAMGFNAVVVPFYAKMSFWDRKILYFDMQFAAGAGLMTYEMQIDPTEAPSEKKTTPYFNIDASQQLFFSQNWAVRVDLKNKWSKQNLSRFRLSGATGSDRDLGTTVRQDTTVLLGITYFIGRGE